MFRAHKGHPVAACRRNQFYASIRSIFSDQKIIKLEQEANSPSSRTDVLKQRALMRELFNNGKYKQVISRFEGQPQLPSSSAGYAAEYREKDLQLLQTDPVLLETYIAAMIMDGKSGKVVEKISPLIRGSDFHRPILGTSLFPPSQQPVPSPFRESEPVPHVLTSNPSHWQSEIDKKQPASRFASANGGLPRGEDVPIKVVLSEAWSWSKFTRTFATRILYGILLMTGLSVVLDQQGMLKSGMEMVALML
ncbi:hypothetical protein HDU91_004842 [Kappamyces sp. JEL0680]|nr:hypothetical protein HDU91_004842 [Kappamyces sp. JEL0680]